jgi:putative ABC transport system substrate-binding protein
MIRRRKFITLLGGAAAVWPLVARAQRTARVPVIGFLHVGQFDNRGVADFERGLADAGFIIGENVAIEFRWANLRPQELPSLASDLINGQVSVIFAANSRPPLRAAKAATDTIPIVFLYGGDPVKDGFVASLSRPGGNMTGITSMEEELGAKRLRLLHEMVPQAATIGFLTQRAGDDPAVPDHQEAIRSAARSLGLELIEFLLARASATFAERQVKGVLVDNVGFLSAATPEIVRLAEQHKVPTMYPGSAARVGGLMSYSKREVVPLYRQAAGEYVARILKGAKAADLPVQQPTKFELIINLKTASALGLQVPPTMLAIADEVIE